MKDYYKEKKVSNSSLSWFQVSPKYFKLMLDKEIEEIIPSYFEKGQEIHMYILEPEEFDKQYIFMDYPQPKSSQQKAFCETFSRLRKGKKDEKLIKAYKSAYSTKENDEIILEKAKKLVKDFEDYIKYLKLSHKYTKILPTKVLNDYNNIKHSLLTHKKARELMYNETNATFGNSDKLYIKNELPIYWVYKNGIPCKSMVDRIIINHEEKKVILVDLKTSSHLSEFADKAIEYKYNRQLAFYWIAVGWYFKNELNLDIDEYEKETFIVATSTKEIPETKVFKMSERRLLEGLEEIEKLMNELKWHFDNNEWEHSRLYYEGEGIELI